MAEMAVESKSSAALPWWRQLYVQVLIAIVIGITLGHFSPELGQSLKPLGDGFIKLVKMIIAPVIFLTVVLGIAKMGGYQKSWKDWL
jgi:aerobic C4-dicarboxylate transport protein